MCLRVCVLDFRGVSINTSTCTYLSSIFSDKVFDEATRDFEETIHEEERLLKLKQQDGDGQDSVGPSKNDIGGKTEDRMKEKKSNLVAVRAAMRNGDMFTEDLFGEKYLVSKNDIRGHSGRALCSS